MRILGWIFLPFVMIFKNWQQRSVWVNIIGSLFAVSMLSFYVLMLFVTLNGGMVLSSVPSDLRGAACEVVKDDLENCLTRTSRALTNIAQANKTNTARATKTSTAIPPTATPIPPTDTPIPPTDTPIPPTDTPIPPTDTIPPTATTQSQASLNKTAAAKLVNSAAKTAAAKLLP